MRAHTSRPLRSRRCAIALLAALPLLPAAPAAAASGAATSVKRIYIANDDHTDYMWSGDDVQYRSAFINMLDYYMAQAENTAGNPVDSRGRFNADGSFWVWEYEHNKTPAEFTRLINHMRAGDITMPLNTSVLCYGTMPVEAVLRSMYYPGRLERRYNLRFPLVEAMENQTLPGGIASLWAGAGARYSWRGVCGCATHTSWGNRPRDIYNFVGPDGHGVCMKWNNQPNGNTSIGGYAEAHNPTAVVNYLDTDAGFQARWPWDVSGAFGYGGDALQTTVTSFVDASLALSNANRRVIVSNEVDFFQDFLANHASEIPTFSGSFGNEWELYSASMGEVTADFRRHVEKLRSAEALASVASLFNPGFMSGREPTRDLAFEACGMFYEHDWTADGSISRTRRAQWERELLSDLVAYVNPLMSDALAAVSSRVSQPAGVERHLVFNPLSWTRTDFADLPIAMSPPLHVVDVASGAEVPSQIVTVGSTRLARILASNVPSVGYRVYEVRAGSGQSFSASATVTLPSFDNGTYGVTVGASGNITSFVDHKDANRQLVDASGGGSLNDLGSGSGPVVVESSGPVSTTLSVVAGGTPTHQTRVTLYAGIDRVDVEGIISQNFGNNLTYTSKFNLPGFTMRHEETGMIAKVARAAAGGDYADQNARTDWLSFGHFVDLSQSSRGVTISNGDSPFFQAGNSTYSTLDTGTPVIRAVVGMQADGASLGIPNQGGDSHFLNRYALRTHGAYDPAAAMRMALEHQNPLVASRVTGSANSPLPGTTWSLLTLPSSDCLLWALKPAEEGIASGLIARIWNLADAPRTLSLSLPSVGIAQAMHTTHLETDLGSATVSAGALTDNLARQQLSTYRITPQNPPTPITDTIRPARITDFSSP